MKEALYYKKLKDKVVQCELCPQFCVLKDGECGKCHARENQNGKLISLVYGKPCSFNSDPIEKKPFYHFMPGQEAMSIATAGCNFNCKHCQNYEISQAKPEFVPSFDLTPEEAVAKTKYALMKIISYTYTEPTVFYEYMHDIAKIAKKQKVKNALVSNGFINQKPLIELCRFIDGANIDLKSINDKFYREICNGKVKPVLETLKTLQKKGVWIEITNLIIPTLNDSTKDIKNLVLWVKKNLGCDVPLHFSAFWPTYKLTNIPATSIDTLKKARKIALDEGLHYVYTGNLPDMEGSTTFCPKCKKPVIARRGYTIVENKLKKGKCSCGGKIAGVWQ